MLSPLYEWCSVTGMCVLFSRTDTFEYELEFQDLLAKAVLNCVQTPCHVSIVVQVFIMEMCLKRRRKSLTVILSDMPRE